MAGMTVAEAMIAAVVTAMTDDRRDDRRHYSNGYREGYRDARYNDRRYNDRRYYAPPRVAYRPYGFERGHRYSNYYGGPVYVVNDYDR